MESCDPVDLFTVDTSTEGALRLLDKLEVVADVGSLLATRVNDPRFKLGVVVFKAALRAVKTVLARRGMYAAQDSGLEGDAPSAIH